MNNKLAIKIYEIFGRKSIWWRKGVGSDLKNKAL